MNNVPHARRFAGRGPGNDACEPGERDVFGVLAQGGDDALALLEPVRDWLVERPCFPPECAPLRAR